MSLHDGPMHLQKNIQIYHHAFILYTEHMNISPLSILFLSISCSRPDFLSKTSKIEPLCSLICIFQYKGSKRYFFM